MFWFLKSQKKRKKKRSEQCKILILLNSNPQVGMHSEEKMPSLIPVLEKRIDKALTTVDTELRETVDEFARSVRNWDDLIVAIKVDPKPDQTKKGLWIRDTTNQEPYFKWITLNGLKFDREEFVPKYFSAVILTPGFKEGGVNISAGLYSVEDINLTTCDKHGFSNRGSPTRVINWNSAVPYYPRTQKFYETLFRAFS